MSSYEHAAWCEKYRNFPPAGDCTCTGSMIRQPEIQVRESGDALVIWRDQLISDLGEGIDHDRSFIDQARVIIDAWLEKVKAIVAEDERIRIRKLLDGDGSAPTVAGILQSPYPARPAQDPPPEEITPAPVLRMKPKQPEPLRILCQDPACQHYASRHFYATGIGRRSYCLDPKCHCKAFKP